MTLKKNVVIDLYRAKKLCRMIVLSVYEFALLTIMNAVGWQCLMFTLFHISPNKFHTNAQPS